MAAQLSHDARLPGEPRVEARVGGGVVGRDLPQQPRVEVDGLPADEVAALPVYSRVPAIQRDAAVLIDDQAFGAAVSSVSVLSIPFALARLADRLTVAAENAAA